MKTLVTVNGKVDTLQGTSLRTFARVAKRMGATILSQEPHRVELLTSDLRHLVVERWLER